MIVDGWIIVLGFERLFEELYKDKLDYALIITDRKSFKT